MLFNAKIKDYIKANKAEVLQFKQYWDHKEQHFNLNDIDEPETRSNLELLINGLMTAGES